jgi:hypothetical protein
LLTLWHHIKVTKWKTLVCCIPPTARSL